MLVLALLLILLAAVAVFAGQNYDVVPIHLLGWNVNWSLAGVVLVALAAGALATFLVVLFRQLRLRRSLRDTSGKLRKKETELTTLQADLDKAKAELDAARTEIEGLKTTVAAKDQDLVSLRAEIAARVAGSTAEGGNGKGGGQGGEGSDQG